MAYWLGALAALPEDQLHSYVGTVKPLNWTTSWVERKIGEIQNCHGDLSGA